jgi:hypothetical protein
MDGKMSHVVHKGHAVVQQQLKELDQIFQDTMETLNTVAGMEQVAKWRAKTVALLTETVSPQAGQEFAKVQPGPSFTNDLVEEFTDFIDTFRIPLSALAQSLAQAAPRPSGGG